MASPLVVVDTSVWVAFLRRPLSPEGRELALLARGGRAALVGGVVAELLQAVRTTEEEAIVEKELQALPSLETRASTWRMIGRLGRDLRARGRPVPLADLVIAATVIEHGAALYATDEHFESIPGLLRHRTG
ncbi:MAG: PIN domain-containing protein [Planctomycetes bacterium]|nr:PIN domain-containing protein [Planctomycetota bacterium]